jgi:MFS family permease
MSLVTEPKERASALANHDVLRETHTWRNAKQDLRASLRLLATRRFGTFWYANLLSSIGTWAQQVAEPWLLLSIGASPFLIGLDSFAINAPVWLLTLMGGVLADRADRRRVIALFQSIQMLCPTLIALLLFLGVVRPLWIIVLSVIVGVTDALSMPSFQSIVPSIVKRNQIARALALNSAQFNLSRILGPAVAGVLMASAGALACFALSAASYLPFIGVALWILPRRAAKASPRDVFSGRHTFANLLAIVSIPHLRGALLTVFATSTLCGPLVIFTPVLVKGEFHGGAGRFSLAVAAFGVGGLLGAIGLLAVPAEQDRRRWSFRFALGSALILVLIAVVPWFWGLPTLLVFAGAAMTVSNTSANSLLQATTSPQLLGQTASLYLLAMRGGLSLGGLLTGLSMNQIGVRHALLLNGCLAILVVLLTGRTWLRGAIPKVPDEARGVDGLR